MSRDRTPLTARRAVSAVHPRPSPPPAAALHRHTSSALPLSAAGPPASAPHRFQSAQRLRLPGLPEGSSAAPSLHASEHGTRAAGLSPGAGGAARPQSGPQSAGLRVSPGAGGAASDARPRAAPHGAAALLGRASFSGGGGGGGVQFAPSPTGAELGPHRSSRWSLSAQHLDTALRTAAGAAAAPPPPRAPASVTATAATPATAVTLARLTAPARASLTELAAARPVLDLSRATASPLQVRRRLPQGLPAEAPTLTQHPCLVSPRTRTPLTSTLPRPTRRTGLRCARRQWLGAAGRPRWQR